MESHRATATRIVTAASRDGQHTTYFDESCGKEEPSHGADKLQLSINLKHHQPCLHQLLVSFSIFRCSASGSLRAEMSRSVKIECSALHPETPRTNQRSSLEVGSNKKTWYDFRIGRFTQAPLAGPNSSWISTLTSEVSFCDWRLSSSTSDTYPL